MNKVKKVLAGTLIALLLLGGVGTAFAWESPRKPPRNRGAVDLNLSEEQIKELQELSLKRRKEMLELRYTLQAKQLELQTLLLTKEPDEAKINSKVEEIGKLRTDIQKKALEYRNQVRKILTPEQWDKLYSYRWNRLYSDRYLGGRGRRGSWKSLQKPLP